MIVIKEFNWCALYALECVKADVSETNSPSIKIWKSCKIQKTKHMKEVLAWLRGFPEFRKVLQLPTWLLLAEWKSHNLLYNLNYERARTEHVDIEPTLNWKYKLGYIILSLFYWK
jgi:hypothetical protein